MNLYWVIRVSSVTQDGEVFCSRRLRNRNGEWLSAHGSGPGSGHQSGELVQFAVDLKQRPAPVLLLLPATRVTCHEVSFLTRERRHLDRIIPYMLEEQLAVSPEQLHFATAKPVATRVAVAIVDKEWFGRLLLTMESAGIEVTLATSEALALKWNPGNWTILLQPQQVLVRYGEGLGFGIEQELLIPALQALAADTGTPENVKLLQLGSPDPELLSSLTACCEAMGTVLSVNSEVLGFWESLQPDLHGLPDLRQGQFSRRLPLGQYWQQLRVAGISTSVALLAWVLTNVLQLQQLNARQLELQNQTNIAYRQVMPEGVLVNPVVQLRNQLTRRTETADGISVLALLSELSDALATADAVALRRVTLNEQSDDLQLVLAANSNTDIVQLIEHMNQTGMNAVVQNMNQADAEQQAMVLVSRRMVSGSRQ